MSFYNLRFKRRQENLIFKTDEKERKQLEKCFEKFRFRSLASHYFIAILNNTFHFGNKKQIDFRLTGYLRF